ncbi:hypothetical protein [Actinophytocola sediminis]
MDRPIGYWLKQLHNLLETHFDRTLAEVAVSRRHWQLLNTLSRGPHTHDDLQRALAPFWEADAPGLRAELEHGLAARDWIAEDGDTVTLTDRGRAAHATIAARVDRNRAIVLGELTPAQYTETVRVLAVMAGNVEADLAARA